MRDIASAIVTGPTGAIGSALCAELSKEGISVYAVVRPSSARINYLNLIDGIEIVECDAAHILMLPSILKGIRVDAFYHLAWANTTGPGRDDMDSQISNIRYVLDACHAAKALGCRVFVGAGSQAEYGRVDEALTPRTPCFPENGYGMAKLCAGQMSRIECEKLDIDQVWPRILSVYGPYDGESAMIPRVIRQLLLGEKPLLTAGNQIWDYLYASDAAKALYLMSLYAKHGAVYPLGSGIARPLREYIEVLRDTINPALSLGFGEIPYGDKQVMHLEADLSALKADTGFVPTVGFVEGIRRTIQFMEEHNDR